MSEENKIFTVATAHLDTVWRWELAKTIEEFIPDTIDKNIDLIKKYPNYRFNFEGAFRYELIEEYYPWAFEEIKKYVDEGRWCVSGSAYENGDVNIPSPEALFRNFLYGNHYFKEKFGKTSTDIFLPDCFGFGYALPAIARHSHLNGFSTQKLGWGGAYQRPFDIGIWKGVDGSSIYASLNPLSYRHKFDGDVRGDLEVIGKLADNGINHNLPWTMNYYGTGDWGGAPTEDSAKAVNASVYDNRFDENTKVISASSDEIFNELEKLSQDKQEHLPVWNNELVMKSHGAGGYTSRCMSKRLNSRNETLADITERACVTADILTSYKYPKNIIDKAWKRVIQHQFHDDLPGTSTMLQYNDSWNDYFISLSQFKNEYEGAAGAIANELDTSWCSECAVIVNNPVAQKRKAAVEAHIKLAHNAKYIKVVDKSGKELPSQIISKQGKELDIAFIANVESVGYKIYDIQVADKKYNKSTDLKVTEHTLENSKYRLVFNKNGDIASIIDKKLKLQILSKPIKLALHHNLGALNYPSWEMRKDDIDSEPYAYANTPSFEIVENGPARIAIKVSRHAENSKIEQIVSLESNGEVIRVDNFIDWQERRTLLKAQFPLNCTNENACYDLGLGYITRGTNTDNLYEVPAQKWADITDEFGQYGISIFSDCKYGWDKPDEHTLRLTCIHTPTGAFTKDARQDLQDIGRNIFSFGIYSHKGTLASGTQLESECFQKGLTAFQTSSRREGTLGDSLSLLKISTPGVIVRAIKKAEDDDCIVIRVNEGLGKEHKNVAISFLGGIVNAQEIYASEEYINDAKIKEGSLLFEIKPFEVKSFKIKTNAVRNKAHESYKKLDLDFNATGITANEYKINTILQGSGCTLPNELIPESLTVHGITFKMPNVNMDKNIFIPREQSIDIPKGTTKIYIIAASTLGDREITIFADNKERHLTIYSMTEKIGQWDMAGLSQTAKVKNANVAIEFTHTHHPEGDIANGKAYFYLYEIDVRNCKTLTMPEENRVAILAMTAVKKFSNTYLATNLIDSADDNYKFGDIPPIEKIIDKADFVTIRAGKIQDQINGGKGKGFKRDNIITNIIRSYTKSEW
ncbi:MAG: alpha-mannosidase [Eubacterium sp.]